MLWPGERERSAARAATPSAPCAIIREKKYITAYFLILNWRPNDEPERYMLNMRCPPQSCLIVFSCSERVGFHFVGGGGKDFY